MEYYQHKTVNVFFEQFKNTLLYGNTIFYPQARVNLLLVKLGYDST